MKNVFDKSDYQEFTQRVNSLTPESKPKWGTMSVDQMLAHCCVTYEMLYENKHTKPTGIKKFLLKAFVKKAVVGNKPYPKNGRTAPEFIVGVDKDFSQEKQRLLAYMERTFNHGTEYFHNKESHSFGPLTTSEWNIMFAKHLDHHLTQFGA